MLKGIVSGVEKDITRIPMKVGNEYKEGWEVRDNQDRLIWGREDELQTTTGTLQFKGYGLPVKVKSLLGNSVQNGTPTPDAPIMPEFVGVKTANLLPYESKTVDVRGVTVTVYPNKIKVSGKATASGGRTTKVIGLFRLKAGTYTSAKYGGTGLVYYIQDSNNSILGSTFTLETDTDVYLGFNVNDGITYDAECQIMLNLGITALPYEPYGWAEKITNAGQTVPVYLGQTPTVRRIKKLVLTGKENWQSRNDTTHLFYLILNTMKTYSPCMASHYKFRIRSTATTMLDGEITTGLGAGIAIWIKSDDYTTAADFKSYLAAQYAAGTPVTVWYVLSEPETAIVNEPLCKIGDYADELNNTATTLPEIPTTTGQNTLTVDTTLAPSSLTIKGHIKEWQPENLLPVSKFEDLSDPSWWSGGYYIRYNNMPAGTYVMSTNMPEKDPGDVYFNGENALNVPYEGRPVSITINEGDSFYVLFFIDRGWYESILDGTYTVTLIQEST